MAGDLVPLNGALSSARVEPVAGAFRDEILSSTKMQYLIEPQFAAVFWQYCRTAARVALIESWVDGMDITEAAKSDRGQTSALELLRKWTSTMLTLASRLGLDPLSYSKLSKDVVSAEIDLATLLSMRGDNG